MINFFPLSRQFLAGPFKLCHVTVYISTFLVKIVAYLPRPQSLYIYPFTL